MLKEHTCLVSGVKVKSADSGPRLPPFRVRLCWVTLGKLLSLSFLICRMRIIIVA